MYVGRIMRTDLVTVPPDTSLVQAKEIIAEKGIAHLLVVDSKDQLMGIVSDRDVKQSWASPATTLSVHELNYILKQVTVEIIMRKKILTISPDTTIERAANVMQENKISALPVMQGDKLVGIITTTDVMGVLLKALGIDTDSFRFTVLVEDRIGVMAEVARVLQERQVNIRSLVTWPEEKHPGVYQLVMRVAARDRESAIAGLQGAGYHVLTEYVEDLTPYLPGA
ncbi:MAG: CBS domain-containing protein [Deltaproteobacteria bacterium]|nr:CBS domain-containing protein [Deltaproteobacteria bacterium]